MTNAERIWLLNKLKLQFEVIIRDGYEVPGDRNTLRIINKNIKEEGKVLCLKRTKIQK